MEFLKQSTAVTVLIGPFLDDTDGNTAETALTIAQADVRLSKNGGNMAQKGDATSCTHDELGYYTCPLSTTDTGTLGILKVMVHESGALPVWHSFMVVTANVWDTLCSTDQLDVNVTNVAGTSQTGNDNGADINAILVDTAVIGALGAGLTNIPWNSAWDAEVQSECADALTAYDPPTKAEMDTGHGLLATEAKQDIIDTNVDSILADTGTDGVLLATAAMDGIWDRTEGITGSSLSFETILARLYRFLLNKMNITDATGAVAVRNEADSANVATQTITDDDTTTTRTALSWS